MTHEGTPFAFSLGVLRYFYRLMAGAYVLNLSLYLALRLLVGYDWLLIHFFDTFLHVLLLPTFVLFTAHVLLREWRLALATIPLMLVFIAIWGNQFLQDRTPIPGEQLTLRVMTFNIYSGNSRYDEIASVIRTSGADIVALQEIGHQSAVALETALAADYPYHTLHPMTKGTQGQAVFSRYPILEDQYWQYDFLPTPSGHQRVRLALSADTAIVVYNVHPTHPGMNGYLFNPRLRGREIEDLVQRTNAETDPVLLVGDFNMPRLSPDYQAIDRYFDDAFYEIGTGMGWTFPASGRVFPFLRLDYVFYDTAFVPLSIQTGSQSVGSDHLPVLATLQLVETP